MRNANIILVLFILVFALVAGIWVGTISVMHHTYQQCKDHGKVGYDNLILATPLELTCTALPTKPRSTR